MTRTNYDPKTGVAFGVISAQVLDSDLVDQLLYGGQAINHTYRLQKAEAILRARRDAMEAGKPFGEDEEEDASEIFAERFSSDEDYITGTWQNVDYGSSWFGGALHFVIMASPFTRECAVCSPCMPGAGDLHSHGNVLTYDVPTAWRA